MVLGEIKDFIGKKRAYNLDLLANRDFVFTLPENANIESVIITRMRLSLINCEKRRITIEAETKYNSKAIYDAVDSLKLPPYYITQIDITVTFTSPIAGARTKKRTFRISYPDSCNLRHEGRDNILRQMLIISGIELIEIVNEKEAVLV